MKNKIIKSAVALAAVSCFSANAMAAKDITYTTTTTQYSTATNLAATPANGVIASGGFLKFTMLGVANTSVLNAGDTLKVTLSGGAKFDFTTLAANLPVIAGLGTFTAATTVGATAATAITNASSFGNTCVLDAPKTTMTCTVQATTDNNALSVGNTITITIPALVKYALAGTAGGTNVLASATVSGLSLGQNVVKHSDKSTVTAANRTIFNINAATEKGGAFGVSTAADQAKVKALFKGFNTAGTTLLTTAVLGTASTDGSSALAPTGKFLYTISNIPASATKVTILNNTPAAFLTGASDATGAAKTATGAGSVWIDRATGKGYATLTAAAAVRLPAANVVVTMDGTTPIPVGDVTAQVDYLVGTSDPFLAHNVVASTVVANVTRDGTTFTMNRLAPQSTVRMTNNVTNGALGTLTVTAVDVAGAAIANTGAAVTALPTVVGPAKTVTVSAATLQSDFPGAVSYTFTIESKDVTASHRQGVPGVGLTTTVYRSQGANGAGGTL